MGPHSPHLCCSGSMVLYIYFYKYKKHAKYSNDIQIYVITPLKKKNKGRDDKYKVENIRFLGGKKIWMD